MCASWLLYSDKCHVSLIQLSFTSFHRNWLSTLLFVSSHEGNITWELWSTDHWINEDSTAETVLFLCADTSAACLWIDQRLQFGHELKEKAVEKAPPLQLESYTHEASKDRGGYLRQYSPKSQVFQRIHNPISFIAKVWKKPASNNPLAITLAFREFFKAAACRLLVPSLRSFSWNLPSFIRFTVSLRLTWNPNEEPW